MFFIPYFFYFSLQMLSGLKIFFSPFRPFLQHRPKEWFVNNPGHFFQRLPKNRKKSCTIYFNVKWLLNPYLSKKEIQRTWKTKYNIYIFFGKKKDFLNVVFVVVICSTILKVDHISVMLYYLVLAPAQLYIKPGQFWP